jgi:hypothetical protein
MWEGYSRKIHEIDVSAQVIQRFRSELQDLNASPEAEN